MRTVALCLLVAVCASAQPLTRANVAGVLGFEHGSPGAFPTPWGGPTGFVIDNQVFHSGKQSARIQRSSTSPSTFSPLWVAIPTDFDGKTIEWRGFLKHEGVSDFVALWARLDGQGGSVVGFATTQQMQVRGTSDWTEYSITLNATRESKQLYAGFLLSGSGTLWADDFQLLVDGRPIADAPSRVPSVFENDREFDQSSRISITALSDAQVRNLAKLARVWGFLKYYHPTIVTGQRHWDYELFRIMKKVLEADGPAEANQSMLEWLQTLGTAPACTNCASLNRDQAHLLPDVDWLADTGLLGNELSEALQAIYRNRESRASQFYVDLVPGVRNPLFENELSHPQALAGDSGYHLLALFRYWNMIQYFYPDRDVMSDEPGYWVRVLEESIPGMATVDTYFGYQQELLKFIAKINDTHANLWSSLGSRPPLGPCQLPVDIRFVEGLPFVVRTNSRTSAEGNLKPGDVILRLDKVPVADLIRDWTPYYAASNEPTRLRDIGNYMTRGQCWPVDLTIDRGGQTMEITAIRVSPSTLDLSRTNRHDRGGAAFQKLSDDIAYLQLGNVEAAKSQSYIEQAEGTKGLIIDLRNYPSEFVVFSLGQHLVRERTEFAKFTRADLSTPGAFLWTPGDPILPASPRYTGKVVILIDEVTQSQAEYTTMAFRAVPGAIVIGSTTAGADGNVSSVTLPGGLSSLYSGIGVFYPDNRPTQRVGIIPDVPLKPTIAGLRNGRDELIEEAMRQIRNAP